LQKQLVPVAIIGFLVVVIMMASLATAADNLQAAAGEVGRFGYSESQITVLPKESADYDDLCTNNEVDLAKLLVRDMSSNVITQTTVGSQVMLEATVVNNCDNRDNEPLLVIFEVRDPDGITGYLAWQNGTIGASQQTVAGSSWVAPYVPGEYTVRAHYIACLSCPMVLNPVLQYRLTVLHAN
jgi:hypothetical protein